MTEFWTYLQGNVTAWHDPIALFYFFFLALYAPGLILRIWRTELRPRMPRIRRFIHRLFHPRLRWG